MDHCAASYDVRFSVEISPEFARSSEPDGVADDQRDKMSDMRHTSAPLPANETQRLDALRRYGILDTAIERGFEDLTELAAFICGTPISTVTFIDEHRQWFKSHRGLDDQETPRDQAFCAHAILQSSVLIVPDATLDDRFAENPLVTGNPHIRFYAGAPLVTSEGFGLGTLCVIDRVPRTLTEAQQEALRALSRQAMVLLELRKALGDLYAAYRELQALEQAKGDFVTMVSRQLGTPLQSIGNRLAEVLADPKALTGEGPRRTVRQALATSRQLETLSKEVADFSGAEVGTLALRRTVNDVHELVASACEAVRLAPRGGGGLAVQVDDDVGMLVVDAERMVDALVNLLQVALTHAALSQPVCIDVRATPEGVAIVIRAAGPGMSPHDLARLFDPLSGGAGRRRRGAGLGLAIAKAVIEQHRGTVTVEAEVGEGLTFRLTLPHQ